MKYTTISYKFSCEYEVKMKMVDAPKDTHHSLSPVTADDVLDNLLAPVKKILNLPD